jgi:hypothetical protein
MPSLFDNLLARRDAIGVELAELSASKPGGLPNANGPGAGVDHVGYKRGLYDELREINQQIAAASGPHESETVGY